MSRLVFWWLTGLSWAVLALPSGNLPTYNSILWLAGTTIVMLCAVVQFFRGRR